MAGRKPRTSVLLDTILVCRLIIFFFTFLVGGLDDEYKYLRPGDYIWDISSLHLDSSPSFCGNFVADLVYDGKKRISNEILMT